MTSTGIDSPVTSEASTALLPVDDPAVGGDLLAGPHDELVADHELVDGDAHLAGGPGRGVDPLDGDVLGAEAEQRRAGRRGCGRVARASSQRPTSRNVVTTVAISN